jgi:hypothetical protein
MQLAMKHMADRRHQMVLCAHNSVDEIEQGIRDRSMRLPEVDNGNDDWKVVFAAP